MPLFRHPQYVMGGSGHRTMCYVLITGYCVHSDDPRPMCHHGPVIMVEFLEKLHGILAGNFEPGYCMEQFVASASYADVRKEQVPSVVLLREFNHNLAILMRKSIQHVLSCKC